MPSSVAPRLSLAALMAALLLVQPRRARAEDDLTYEYENYREAGGRITVQTHGVTADQDLNPDLHLTLGAVMDTITGATPDGQPAPPGSNQVVLSQLLDRRRAWNALLAQQFSRVNVSASFARSLEHDYVSDGWALNTVTDFNQKNTTLTVGTAGTNDHVEVFFEPAWFWKRTNDVIIGGTQLLDPNTMITADLTWDRSTGYLDEPYKEVLADVEVLPGIFLNETFAENRPHLREKGIGYFALNRAFPQLQGAIEVSYRYYHDTYGITAHTLQLAYFQHLGPRLILRPTLRFYNQTAASFYHYELAGTGIVPTVLPNPAGPLYSSDARLSAFRDYDYGLKAIWTVTPWLAVDSSLENYIQHGKDQITPQSAYYRATIGRAGVKLSW